MRKSFEISLSNGEQINVLQIIFVFFLCAVRPLIIFVDNDYHVHRRQAGPKYDFICTRKESTVFPTSIFMELFKCSTAVF
jgi:hypothetical protein